MKWLRKKKSSSSSDEAKTSTATIPTEITTETTTENKYNEFLAVINGNDNDAGRRRSSVSSIDSNAKKSDVASNNNISDKNDRPKPKHIPSIVLASSTTNHHDITYQQQQNHRLSTTSSLGSNISDNHHYRPKRIPSIDSAKKTDKNISSENNNRPKHIPSIDSTKKKIEHSFSTSSRKLCPYSHTSKATPSDVSSPVKELATAPSGKCPFRHGTVYAGPYPGYCHGNPNRGICPKGCRALPNADITSNETPKQTLLREAFEYMELYYHERTDDMKGMPNFLPMEKRMEQIKQSIDHTGTYEHTFDELQHGSRVSWRNAPKCANRKYWGQLKLLDCRDVTTNKGMFDSCMKHLTMATKTGATEAYITVFKPKHPGQDKDGPRLWNDQLLQYASYRQRKGDGDQGVVIGDQKNLRFTEMLKERFGWNGPKDGKQGAYDYLPLVIQADPDEPPEMFEVPLEVAPPVHIHHPQYPELSSLQMKWYPIPAVCALDMTLGGVTYTAVPFNGWYASTEVLRDLTDEGRYNMLVPVAKALGLDSDTKPGDAPLWIDDVMAILNKAVFYSFKTAKIAMIDHHNLINMFWDWYHDELKSRKYCPVNWKWVIPPMSSSTSPAYLGLNKAQEYTLKPAYIIGMGFLQLETNYFGPRDRTKAVNDLIRSMYLALLFKRMVSRYKMRKQPVLIIYASVTGNAANYAYDLGNILSSSCNVTFFDACGVNASKDEKVLSVIESTTLTIFVSSTQGNGELPSLSRKFFSFLFDEYGHLLKGKNCAVLGFGSSAYPIFCGGAAELTKRLGAIQAKEVVSRGECDAVQGETPSFMKWTAKLVQVLASAPSASRLMVKLAKELKENNTVLVKRGNMIDFVSCEIFTAKEVETAAARVFMRRRGSTSKQRRTSRRNSLDPVARRSSLNSSVASVSSVATTERSNNSSPNTTVVVTDERNNSSSRWASSTSSIHEEEEEEWTPRELLTMKIISCSGESFKKITDDVLIGEVINRTDLISNETIYGDDGEEIATRKTSLVKIDLDCCGNPPYQPGDHVHVFPKNVVSTEKLEFFVSNLAGDLGLDSHIYVTFESEEIERSELEVALPLLAKSIDHMVSLDYFFEQQVASLAPISMQACHELAKLAPSGKDKSVLRGLSQSSSAYERMNSLTGLKWIDLFSVFPSLSKLVSMSFLLCNMKMNHPRSYSISSCKAIVGSELHLCVGRFIYSRGGSKLEAGICSNFLTTVEPGDEIHFKIESSPSFHHPLDPSCPIIFICTGTGIAPIRGLLMKRSYFKSRGERLGPSFLIFGSRNIDEGLFHDEVKQFQKEGVITKTWMCYSREHGQPKEYTGDKLGSDRVKKLLSPVLAKPNTHIFICGSANMAEQSKAILGSILSKPRIAKMTATGRMHCDVFGALSSSKSKPSSRKNSKFSARGGLAASCFTVNTFKSAEESAKNEASRSLSFCDMEEFELNSDDGVNLEDLLVDGGPMTSSSQHGAAQVKERRSSLKGFRSKSQVITDSDMKEMSLLDLICDP